ncbi:hypothetical protein OG339_47445 (plasmid) [Streptosporangium sp. NBC_01495]|uniref:hypothetical protein n=1 Tax=Streptosporangium sp. NBC_01495 TaxID=2903899 RepID=UPI002E31F116|nr:hypothetical protein [Streptosporangium sp. NBC_01495]
MHPYGQELKFFRGLLFAHQDDEDRPIRRRVLPTVGLAIVGVIDVGVEVIVDRGAL